MATNVIKICFIITYINLLTNFDQFPKLLSDIINTDIPNSVYNHMCLFFAFFYHFFTTSVILIFVIVFYPSTF